MTGRPRTKPRPDARARKGFAVFARPSAARDWATTARTAPVATRNAKRRRRERPVRSQSQRRSGESVASRGISTKRRNAPRIAARPEGTDEEGREAEADDVGEERREAAAVAVGGETPGEAAGQESREDGVEEAGRQEAGERSGEAGEVGQGKRPLLERVQARPVAEEAGLGAQEVRPEDDVPAFRQLLPPPAGCRAGRAGARREEP